MRTQGYKSPSEALRELAAAALAERRVGARRLEEMLGLPRWALRGLLDAQPKEPGVDKAKAIAEALGLELYLGPPRTAASAYAFSELQATFNGPPAATYSRAGPSPEPGHQFAEDISSAEIARPARASDDSFYIEVADDTLSEAGIPAGSFCLVDPNAELREGRPARFVDRDGRAALRIYQGRGKSDAYLTTARYGDTPFREELTPAGIASVAPVVAAFAQRPEPGSRQPNLLSDGRQSDTIRIGVLGGDTPDDDIIIPRRIMAGRETMALAWCEAHPDDQIAIIDRGDIRPLRSVGLFLVQRDAGMPTVLSLAEMPGGGFVSTDAAGGNIEIMPKPPHGPVLKVLGRVVLRLIHAR